MIASLPPSAWSKLRINTRRTPSNDKDHKPRSRKMPRQKITFREKQINKNATSFCPPEIDNTELKYFRRALSENENFQIEQVQEIYDQINDKKNCNKNDNSKMKRKGDALSSLPLVFLQDRKLARKDIFY